MNIYQNLIALFKKNKGYIHENLYIKFSEDKGWGVYAKKKIPLNTKETLIKIPLSLTISEVEMLNFIQSKKTNYTCLEFLQIYLESLPNIEFYKNNHPYFCNNTEKDLMIQILKNNLFLKNSLSYQLKNFELLGKDEKFIFLTFLTRTGENNNKKFLMQIIDIVNFDYNQEPIEIDLNYNFISIDYNKSINADEEIFVRYAENYDPIEFFLTYGFVTKDYKSFRIPRNALFLKKSGNNSVNPPFIKKNNKYYFTEDLIFKKEELPKNLNNFLSIFPDKNNSFLEIIESYEKSFDLNLINKISKEKKYSGVIKKFCKSVKLHIENIRLYKILFILRNNFGVGKVN